MLFYAVSVDNVQRQTLLEVNPGFRCIISPSDMACSLYIVEIQVRVMMKGLLQLYVDPARAL